jgi:hypothetical protein
MGDHLFQPAILTGFGPRINGRRSAAQTTKRAGKAGPSLHLPLAA